MLRKIMLTKESTLKSSQIEAVNSTLTSLYNKLDRVFKQDKVETEPTAEDVGSPVGAVYDYKGKRLNNKYFFSFKLDVTSLLAGYGHILIKDLPEVIDMYSFTTNTFGNELKGYFTISSRNANTIEVVYVPYQNQEGTFEVTITGETIKND
jgi:hypothetical protein